MRRSLSALGAALLVVLLAGCSLFDWPQYGATGANTGKALLSSLDTHTVGSLQQAWAVPSRNVAPATLAVVDGTVYASSGLNQLTFNPTFVPPPPPLEAHSVTDGTLRWSAGGATITSSGGEQCLTETVGTVPVVSNGRYDYLSQTGECALGPAAGHSCADASIDATTGTEGAFTSNPDGCIIPGEVSFGSDPVAASDGTVYVVRTGLFGQGPNGLGPAVIGSDGSVLIVPGTNSSAAALSTPAVNGNTLFVVASPSDGSAQLVAFDRTTHQMLWSQPLGQLVQEGQPTPTPSVADGRVFVATTTTYLLATFTDAKAFDATTGQPLWSAALPDAPTVHAPAATGNDLFVRTGSTLLALDATSGATLWQAPIGTASSAIPTLGSPSVANDIVFVGTQDGKLLAFDATGKTCGTTNACSPIWSATVSGATDSSRPAISGDAVYISAANGTAGSSLYKFSLFGR
jgi:outer membrane protein assembly factor BamB